MRYKKSFCKIHSIRLASHLWRLIAIDLLLYCPTCQCIYRTFCKYTGFTDSVCLQTALLKLFTDSNIEIVYRQCIQTALLKLFLHTAFTGANVQQMGLGFRVQGYPGWVQALGFKLLASKQAPIIIREHGLREHSNNSRASHNCINCRASHNCIILQSWS